jgi:site-specific DNA recombinase
MCINIPSGLIIHRLAEKHNQKEGGFIMSKNKIAAPLTAEALENMVDLYIRVSTTEQAEEGYSVEEQENRGRAYCEAYGFIINAVHVDPGYSGSTMDRPGIKEVIKDVKCGKCKKVIVWKLDRLSRSQKDTLILLEDVFLANGCNFVSIMESFDTSTPFGRCVVGILAAFAQMERENIKARTMMGKQAGLKEGNYYSGRTPTGYRSEVQPNGKKALVVDSYTSQMVQDMYRLYGAGRSLGEVADYVTEKYGYRKNDAREARRCSISKILRNPVYKGIVKMKDKEYEGKHDAIVATDLWERVNSKLEKNRKAVVRMYTNSEGLCSGLLWCGCCGARIAIRTWGVKDRKKKKYVCYSVSKANKLMIKDPNCSNRKSLDAADLDELVLNEIKKLSLDPAALDSLIEENATEAPADPDGFAERLEEIEKQIKRLLNLYQTGVVELEEVQGRLADLKEERVRVTANLEEMQNETDGKMSKAAALASLASFEEILKNGTPNDLFSLVHNLIEKIVILNGDITIYWAFC